MHRGKSKLNDDRVETLIDFFETAPSRHKATMTSTE